MGLTGSDVDCLQKPPWEMVPSEATVPHAGNSAHQCFPSPGPRGRAAQAGAARLLGHHSPRAPHSRVPVSSLAWRGP